MKLSYRDKLILLVFVVVAIIFFGIIFFIKPKSDEIATKKTTLKTVEENVEKEKSNLKLYNDLEVKIMETYDESTSYNDDFIEKMKNYEIDQYLQPYLDKNEMKVINTFNISKVTSDSLETYFYTPDVVTYPIYVAASVNSTKVNEVIPADSELGQQVVYASTLKAISNNRLEVSGVQMDVNCEREQLYAFLADMAEIKGLRVTNVSIKDYSFNTRESIERMSLTQEQMLEFEKIENHSDISIVIEFYGMQELVKPIVSGSKTEG